MSYPRDSVTEPDEKFLDLERGDKLKGKKIIRIDYIKDTRELHAPLAIVTRVWGKRMGETEYVTHVMNLQTGGCSYGAYTVDENLMMQYHDRKLVRFSQ